MTHTEQTFIDNTFYINSFFRETKEGNKLGLMFKGTTFENDDKTSKLVIYHIDSTRTGKNPFLILDLEGLSSLSEKIRNFIKEENDSIDIFTNIEEWNLKINFDTLKTDENILIGFRYAGKNYSLPINRGEFEVFINSISYIKSYNTNLDPKLEIVKNKITKYTDTLIQILVEDKTITLEQVYKNKWIKSGGEIKKYDIPTIQHSVHGAKTQGGGLQKVHYYFKFFPTYLINSFRRKSIEDDIKFDKISGSNFPIHIITQETGKPSALITMSEMEFSIFQKYMKSPKLFLNNPEHPLVKFANNSDIVKSVSDKYVLSMKNEYNGKVYTNEDVITKEQFDTITELKNGAITDLVTYVKTLGLEKNKFINDKTVESMEIRKNEFVNFKISRTDDGKIDDRAIFVQISYNVANGEYIITTMKGDIKKGGIRYISAPFKSNEAKGLLYKLSLIQQYITDYSMTILDEIDRNIKTLDFLPLNEEQLKDVSKNIEDIFNNMSGLFFTEGDTKFAKKFEIDLDNGNKGTFSLFSPDTLHIFNTEAFSEWKNIEKLKEHKYPIRFGINDDKGEKLFTSFILDLSDLGGIIEGNYNLVGKSNGKFRQLSFDQTDTKIIINYGESTSAKGPFDSKEIGQIDLNVFNNIYKEFMYSVIMNSGTNLKKSIQYHKLNLIGDKK